MTGKTRRSAHWVLSRVAFGISRLSSTCCINPKLKVFFWADLYQVDSLCLFAIFLLSSFSEHMWVLLSRSQVILSYWRGEARNMSLVLIDDTSPNIQYSGPWFEVENTQISTGDFGPPFQNTLHGVNVTANFSFPFSGLSRLLILLSIPLTLSSFFRNGNLCLRDKHNDKCFWDARSNLGMFYRQYQHRLVYCAVVKWKQLDHVWQYPVTRWTPCAHRESKRFESANFLVRSDSVQFSFQRNVSAYRFEQLGITV